MSRLLELRVAVAGDESSNLQTVGELYRSKTKTEPAKLVVTHVIASQWQANRFALDKGKYEYRFHIERAGGKFTLTLFSDPGEEDEEELGSDDYDTSLGFEHRVFKFEVES